MNPQIHKLMTLKEALAGHIAAIDSQIAQLQDERAELVRRLEQPQLAATPEERAARAREEAKRVREADPQL